MIKPDWNKFKAKFSENPQDNFEWFCYLLFCKEFNKPLGVPGYFNHRHIENAPITIDGETIGWQAKFYDTKLSSHKEEIIKLIKGSKEDYSNITKIIFYTNKNWGQGKIQNDSKVKIEIDEEAERQGIELDWNHMANFFDSPFVTIENSLIAQHFFADKSLFDFIERRRKLTESILYEIQTNIKYNTQIIEIERSKILQNIQETLDQKQMLILTGVGGVGKTAIVKKLYNEIKEKVALYVFKANEFNVNNIVDLLGNTNLQDFIEIHKNEKNKIIVIDSSEKLLELQNKKPFKEFISFFIRENWKIIFTARSSYLLDLNNRFIDCYQIVPSKFYIKNLIKEELEVLSQTYNFILPDDYKLLELIKNPFYLNEYLKFYKKDEKIDYLSFKKNLWNKIIYKSKPAREQCFLQIAFQRASEGQFFVSPNCDSQILKELCNDGILGYETTGYFIAHDIYEEWALEKRIESEFIKKENNGSFFQNIGESLPIRRCFRNWISEKLFLEDSSIENFIEEVIDDETIELFWQDEILVSVLLSDYSDTFFSLFKEKILVNDQKLLKKLSFLLRIACKEVDTDFFKILGIKNIDLFSIKYVLTKPKGKGWESLIKFVCENLDAIGIQHVTFFLPIIYDWNYEFKKGQTTKSSSLIALKYYKWLIHEDVYISPKSKSTDELFKTILYGAIEIKKELTNIFDEVLGNKWKKHRNPYFDLIKVILTNTIVNKEIIVALPEYILELADLFWFKNREEEEIYPHFKIGVEQYFCIEETHQDYYPPSAYQTPIYWLLQFSLQKTIDFILSFINKTVECFAKSDFAKNEIEEINIIIDDKVSLNQYISNRLWNTYRGTQASTHILESIHMALEKYFLKIGKTMDSKTLEAWLLYLLKKSKSASISAVVASIVSAYPEKTFNIAKILFKTKEFFDYDRARFTLEYQAQTVLHMFNNFGNNSNSEIHNNERLKPCDEVHRKRTLEQLILTYQFLKTEKVTKEEIVERQKEIWSIFDKYYEELSDKTEETEKDKAWRYCLAKMDMRKIKPTIEEKDGQNIISFTPEIEPELKEFSESFRKIISEQTKYTPLSLWANYKLRNDEQYKQYSQYNNNPKLALKEVKEILNKIKINRNKAFDSLIYSTPANVCSILIRDYFEKLPETEKQFCKNYILKQADDSLKSNYRYKDDDGKESIFSVLPILFQNTPNEKAKIKRILLFSLFNEYSIDMDGEHLSSFYVQAIHKLWNNNFEDAQSLLLGYLLLKPKYEGLRKRLHKEQLLDVFEKENMIEIQRVIENKVTMDDLKNIEQLDLYILNTAFQIIPLKTNNKDHKILAQLIISTFAKKLSSVYVK